MSEPDDKLTDVAYEGVLGKFRARGRDPVLIIGTLASLIFGYFIYTHSERTDKAFASMLREQRLMTCILASKEAERELQYSNPTSFCNRMSQ